MDNIFDVLRHLVHHSTGWASDEHKQQALDLIAHEEGADSPAPDPAAPEGQAPEGGSGE